MRRTIYIAIDGPPRLDRDRISYTLALWRRMALSRQRRERFGARGEDEIRQFYHRLTTARYIGGSLRVDKATGDGAVDAAVLRDVEALISGANRCLAAAATDSAVDLTERQAEAARRHLERFAGWVSRRMLCSEAECAESPSCSARGKIGLHARGLRGCPRPPRCMAVIMRDVDQARALVEEAYRGLLDPKRPLHVYISFAPDSRSHTVNGRTERFESDAIARLRPPSALRTSRIELFLPEPLSAEAAFKILYTVAHEIGVHATQQIDRHGAPNGDNSTAFSEGLVEEAMFDALDRALPRSRFWLLHREGSHVRHEEHQGRRSPGSTPYHNVNDIAEIARGSRLWLKLVDLGQAALDAERQKQRGRPRAPSGGLATGKDWARKLVLALNTLPLGGQERQVLFDRLMAELDIAEQVLRAALAGRMSRVDRGEAPSAVVALFVRLNGLLRAPLDARSRDRVMALAR